MDSNTLTAPGIIPANLFSCFFESFQDLKGTRPNPSAAFCWVQPVTKLCPSRSNLIRFFHN